MRTFHREGGGRRENVNLRYNDVHYTVNSCPRMEMYETALKPHFVTRVPKIDNLAISWPFPSVFHVSVKIRPSSITNVYRANKYSVTCRVSYIMCCNLLSLPKFLFVSSDRNTSRSRHFWQSYSKICQDVDKYSFSAFQKRFQIPRSFLLDIF